MAVVNTLSNVLTNIYGTSPNLLNATYLDHDYENTILAENAVTSTDNIASVYRICRVSSQDCIQSIFAVADALGGSCTIKLGLYEVNSLTAAESTAGNIGIFVTNAAPQSFVSALAGTELRWLSLTATSMKKRVWEILGLTVDSKKNYDLCYTVVAVPANTGVIATRVKLTH